MSEHTPGPWTRDHGLIRGEGGTQIALVAWDIEANARLIAAAPDLLAALETAHDILDDLNAENSEVTLCLFCAATEYDGEVGIQHEADCVILEWRGIIEQAKTKAEED